MTLPAHSGPRPLIQFRNHFSQTVGLLRRVISPSQGRCPNTGQHKQNKRIHTHQTSMPQVGFWTHDPSVRASEDSSCLSPRGYCDRQMLCHTKHYCYLELRVFIDDNADHGVRAVGLKCVRSLKHWVGIPLDAWMSVCVFSCVGSGLATGWSPSKESCKD
jgi:hypothetical protein